MSSHLFIACGQSINILFYNEISFLLKQGSQTRGHGPNVARQRCLCGLRLSFKPTNLEILIIERQKRSNMAKFCTKHGVFSILWPAEPFLFKTTTSGDIFHPKVAPWWIWVWDPCFNTSVAPTTETDNARTEQSKTFLFYFFTEQQQQQKTYFLDQKTTERWKKKLIVCFPRVLVCGAYPY